MTTDVPVVRRRMTSRELRIWRALLDTTADLRRILGAQLQESNLSPADYAVLLALSEAAGREVRSTQLAAMMEWERSRLSHHLGRMERRGLIRRDRVPHRQPRRRGVADRGRGGRLPPRVVRPTCERSSGTSPTR